MGSVIVDHLFGSRATSRKGATRVAATSPIKWALPTSLATAHEVDLKFSEALVSPDVFLMSRM